MAPFINETQVGTLGLEFKGGVSIFSVQTKAENYKFSLVSLTETPSSFHIGLSTPDRVKNRRDVRNMFTRVQLTHTNWADAPDRV